MGKVLFLGLVLLISCKTTSEVPAPKTIKDVKIGDTLFFHEPELADCSVEVKNIATMSPTPVGVIAIPPTICGPLHCTKGSIPEAAIPMPVCLLYSKLKH